ncbi:U3 snoRNP protein [Savitreella phatthalungensis]
MIPSKRLKTQSTKRTHVWKSFNQRLESIDVHITRKVDRRLGDSQNVTSFFLDALAHWAELNLTVSFKIFLDDIEPLAGSLPQVLHHQHAIFTRLSQLIQTRDPLVEEPALALLVALARDLQADFTPIAPDALSLLVHLADHEDVQVVEAVFTSMAHLFRFLAKHLIKALPQIFTVLRPLLAHKRPHLVRFTSQAFSYLLRRQRDGSIFDHMLVANDCIEGCGLVVAEALFGPGRSFDSRGLEKYSMLLTKEGAVKVARYAAIAAVHHSDIDHFPPFLDTILSHKTPAATAALAACCTVRKGTRIPPEYWHGIVDRTTDAKLLAVAFAYAPLTKVMGDVPTTVAKLQDQDQDKDSLSVFAMTLAKLNIDTFNALFLPKCRNINHPAVLLTIPQLGKLTDPKGLNSNDKAEVKAVVDLLDGHEKQLHALWKRTPATQPVLLAAILDRLRDPALLTGVLDKPVWTSAAFLEAAHATIQQTKTQIPEIIPLALANLDKPGRQRRLWSIRLLATQPQLQSDVFSSLESLEAIELDLHAPRALAMQGRRIAQLYPSLTPEVRRVCLRQSFGLLTGNFTPLWDIAIDNLKAMSEDDVWQVVYRWLTKASFGEQPDEDVPEVAEEETIPEPQMDALKCFNTAEVEQIFAQNEAALTNPQTLYARRYAACLPTERTSDPRSQAIKILMGLTSLAEQHNRDLVPLFLEGTSLLELFSKFDNPGAAYRADEVRAKAMSLLGTRDNRTQTHALDLLMHFRDKALTPYEDNLKNLLGQTRSRDEITTFLQVNEGDSPIEDDHRAAVIPVVARILYGKMMDRRHNTSAKHGQANTRTIILSAVATLRQQDIAEFIPLFIPSALDTAPLPVLTGFCNMMEEAFEQLGSKLTPFLGSLLPAILLCHEREPAVRQTCSRIIALAMASCRKYDWPAVLSELMRVVVAPRLDKFATESTQAPSPLLRLFATWAEEKSFNAFLLKDDRILPQTFALLSQPTVKDTVIRTVLTLVQALVDNEATSCLSPAHCNQLFGHLLHVKPEGELLRLQASVLGKLAHVVNDTSTLDLLLDLLIPLLTRPERLVPRDAKDDILILVRATLPRVLPSKFEDRYLALTSLFRVVPSPKTRQVLCDILTAFANHDSRYAHTASIVSDLNAMSRKRFDTPDFDRRLAAFTLLNETAWQELDRLQWHPILQNLVFALNDKDELAIRTNAGYAFDRFFQATELNDLSSLLDDVYDAVVKGFRITDESLRSEWVNVLGSAVRTCTGWTRISDLRPLLMEDDEANFFSNILHIQQHRRLRALARLATMSRDMQPSNIAHLLMPLVEHFCNLDNHNIRASAITTLGQLAAGLQYPQFLAVYKRHAAALKEGSSITVRLIGNLVDAFVSHEPSRLLDSRPKAEKLETALTNSLLPPLVSFLEDKDEATLPLRVPLTLTIVKLTLEQADSNLAPVLTHIAHVLRSRSQDARDKARAVIGDIAGLLGPQGLPKLLQHLVDALQRGYQLHVLGFTVHGLLAKLDVEPGAIDGCLALIVRVLVDDLFGETGAEKDAEGYVSSMKEVKAHRSYDSFEIIARIASLTAIGTIIHPVRQLLIESSSIKSLRKIDEVLRRMSLGLLKNDQAASREGLTLCYNIYEQAATAPKNGHKLIRFSLDILRNLLTGHPELCVPSNVAAFVPVIGDAVMSPHEDVQMSSLRILTHLVKLDEAELQAGMSVFVDRAMQLIRSSPSTKTELAQTALKFMAAVLRDRQSTRVQDRAIAYLLTRVRADLEEPDRQATSFALVRAVLNRKTMLTEVYETMDAIAEMVVTSQSSSGRAIARSALFAFLLDYPQGKARFRKQISFVLGNLTYIHSSGRQSVLQLLDQIVSTFPQELLKEDHLAIALALTMCMVNDDEAICREGAAKVLKRLIDRTDDNRQLMSAVKQWFLNGENPTLIRAAAQVFGIVFEAGAAKSDDIKVFIDMVRLQIKSHTADQQADWQPLYYCLIGFTKLLASDPDTYLSAAFLEMWVGITDLLMFQHAWVRLAACRLLGNAFGGKSKVTTTALVMGKNLSLTSVQLVTVSRKLVQQLRSPHVTQDLSSQVSKNLVFLLRLFDEAAWQMDETSCVEWLTRKLASLLQTDKDLDKAVAGMIRSDLIRILAATTQKLASPTIEHLAGVITRPLYKYAEAEEASSTDKEDLRELAKEALDLLRERLGPTAFAQVYNETRRNQLDIRASRLEKRRIDKVANPDQAAAKRIKMNIRKKERRQELSQDYRRRREIA